MSGWRHVDPRAKALGLWLLDTPPCAINQA